MKKGCTGLLRSSAGLGGPADPLVGLLGPVLGMLLGVGPSVSCVMLGERSQVSLLLVLLRDLPHTYSCTCFYSTKQMSKQTRTLPVVNTGESILLLNKYLKKPKFLLFYVYFLFYSFVLCFFHGKLGLMGNWAGWKHDRGMHELWNYLPDRTRQAWTIVR